MTFCLCSFLFCLFWACVCLSGWKASTNHGGKKTNNKHSRRKTKIQNCSMNRDPMLFMFQPEYRHMPVTPHTYNYYLGKRCPSWTGLSGQPKHHQGDEVSFHDLCILVYAYRAPACPPTDSIPCSTSISLSSQGHEDPMNGCQFASMLPNA